MGYYNITDKPLLASSDKKCCLVKKSAEPSAEAPVMVIMIGIPGAGKSTFARNYNWTFEPILINLDTLKTRNREMSLILDAINHRQCLIIDNTNITRLERARYIHLAKENGYKVYGYFMQSVIKDCISRNENRANKVPIKAIIAKSNQLEIPTYDEGFDMLKYVRINKNVYEVSNWKIE